MLHRFRSVPAVALAALAVSLVAVPAGAAPKTIVASKNHVPAEAGDPITNLAVLYATGFEAPFVVGPAEPQQGFTATGTNNAWASISAANPHAGAQHLRLVRNPSAGQGASHNLLAPNNPGIAPNSPSQVTMMVNISNDQGADYDVIGQAPSQASVAWRVKFSWSDATGAGPGSIFILDNTGAGIAYEDPGVVWTPGVWKQLKVQFDPAMGQIRYYYDGVHIYTGSIFAATCVQQLVWFDDNYHLTGERGDFDGVTWLDTPSDPVPATPATWGKIKGQYR
jgi:hypothetical protein